MFRSEAMQRVRLVCLEKDKQSLVSALHKLGMIDLRKSKLELADDLPASNFTKLSDTEIMLTGAIAILKRPKPAKKGAKIPDFSHIGADRLIEEISSHKSISKIYQLNEAKKSILQGIRPLEHSLGVARQLSGIDININELRSNVLGFGAYVAPNRKEVEGLKDYINRRKLQIEVVEPEDKAHLSIIVAYKKGIDIDAIARKYNLKELDISADYLNGSPADALISITGMINEEKGRVKQIDNDLAAISASDYSVLRALKWALEIEMTKAEVSGMFKKTESTVVIEGWIPAKKFGEVEATAMKASGKRCYIERLPADELAPTLINRPKILQPFDYMINFISVPRSDELDPGILFMVSFPILYGIMISDVGYGILSFFFAWYITKITNPDGLVYNTAKIWQLCAISAIFFGFLSNQYFGLALNHYFTSFAGFDWFKNITIILAITVVIGLINVVAGLIFGFFNNYKHHRKLAFGKLAAVSLMITGSVAICGALFGLFNPTITMACAVIAIISLILTMVLSGEEAGEVTNLISHPLSYARLMGFGLASIVLAFLIDMAFTPKLSLGIPLFIGYLVIFLILHFMNMIVSMFEGAVQGARLNFIESFSKFYKGGGIKFNPFGTKKFYAKE
jgi:V/A-type H+-transporting ATPase subunit I